MDTVVEVKNLTKGYGDMVVMTTCLMNNAITVVEDKEKGDIPREKAKTRHPGGKSVRRFNIKLLTFWLLVLY